MATEPGRATGSAPAAPGQGGDSADKPAAPDAQQEARYQAAVKRGQDLMGKGEHAAAVAAFNEALAVRPDDARALSELSWAAFKAGDLEAAASAAEKSIARTGNPRLRAASLYNLGRVKEAQGDRDAAKQAYMQSLALRENGTVEERLRALGGEQPKNTYAPVLLAGPYTSLEAYCAGLEAPMECEPGATRLAVHAAVAAMTRPPAPFLEVRWFGYRDRDGVPHDNLAVRTASGWFVKDSFEEVMGRREASIDEVTYRHGRILIRHSAIEGRFETEHEKLLTVCGIGSSGKVSCTPSISLEWAFQGIKGNPKSDEGYEELPLEYTHKLSAELQSASLLVIKPRDPGNHSENAVAVGEHTLLFP